jgi:excisionase family DNA binding protein
MTIQELIDAGRDLLTREETANLLTLKVTTLAAWATKGWYASELPVVRIGNRTVRYRREDVERFIANRTGKPVEKIAA